MRSCVTALAASCRPRLALSQGRTTSRRCLLTLAIETSCDDTSVAVLESLNHSKGPTSAILHFHKKITSNNTQYQGVHPLASLYSHQENLAKLVDEAILHLPTHNQSQGVQEARDATHNGGSTSFRSKRLPDFISVTRGPGLRSNLFTGLDTAKGLAAAWQIDLVGVHHMQAHALTPRLVSALQKSQQDNTLHQRALPDVGPSTSPSGTTSSDPIQAAHPPVAPSVSLRVDVEPNFPFLSVLASGGHTLLIQSTSLTEHEVLATTTDIAVGDCLDKVARVVLPPELLDAAKSTMYGPLLEKFAFSQTPELESGRKPGIETPGSGEFYLEDNTAREYQAMYATRYAYVAPRNHEVALRQNRTKWSWSLNQPLVKAGGGSKSKSMEMSFSGLLTATLRAFQFQNDTATGKATNVERVSEDVSMEERRDMAREAMRAAFEHVAGRVVLALQQLVSANVPTVVMSGGVAANSYLRYILASTLVMHGFPDVRIVFPPVSLCTDNAAMIAWAGIEMYAAGYKDPREIRAIRKWPLDRLLSPQQDV